MLILFENFLFSTLNFDAKISNLNMKLFLDIRRILEDDVQNTNTLDDTENFELS